MLKELAISDSTNFQLTVTSYRLAAVVQNLNPSLLIAMVIVAL